MTELWTCTDCDAEVDFNERHEHMKAEHGAMHSVPVPYAPDCQQCERMTAMEASYESAVAGEF